MNDTDYQYWFTAFIIGIPIRFHFRFKNPILVILRFTDKINVISGLALDEFSKYLEKSTKNTLYQFKVNTFRVNRGMNSIPLKLQYQNEIILT